MTTEYFAQRSKTVFFKKRKKRKSVYFTVEVGVFNLNFFFRAKIRLHLEVKLKQIVMQKNQKQLQNISISSPLLPLPSSHLSLPTHIFSGFFFVLFRIDPKKWR